MWRKQWPGGTINNRSWSHICGGICRCVSWKKSIDHTDKLYNNRDASACKKLMSTRLVNLVVSNVTAGNRTLFVWLLHKAIEPAQVRCKLKFTKKKTILKFSQKEDLLWRPGRTKYSQSSDIGPMRWSNIYYWKIFAQWYKKKLTCLLILLNVAFFNRHLWSD